MTRNLRDLEYLVAVAELHNFRRAAERCHVSQPALSNQIRKLEDTLGVQLFERGTRQVMTTAIGLRLVEAARRVLREAAAMEELAASARDPLSGRFALGAFPTLAPYLLPTLVPRLLERLPALRMVLIEEKTQTLLERLRAGDLDAALVSLPVGDPTLGTAALFEDEFLLAVPPGHALAKSRQVSQAMLAKHDLLLLDEGHCLRDQALSVCDTAGAEEQDVRATSLETLRQMVKAGTGITFMPRIAIQAGEKDICYLRFRPPVPRRTIGLAWRTSSARGAVIEAIRALYAEPAGDGARD